MSTNKEKIVLRLDQVAPTAVDWLWPNRFAAGKLTLLDGDPGQGKSLITLDLAARISSGRPWPDGQPSAGPAAVVLLGAEDSLADIVLPRLQAAGADLARIVVLHGKSANGGARCACFPEDCDLLEETVRETGARLAVIDPFLAFLSARVSNLNDQIIRQALGPLASLAEKTRAAIQLVRHLTKTGRNRRALQRGTGAMAIVGAARTAFLVAPHPDDAELRLFACTKNNLGPLAPTLAYRVRQDAERSSAVEWLGEVPIAADELMGKSSSAPSAPGDAHRQAVDCLHDILGHGRVASATVYRVARASGIADRTLQRAKAQEAIVSEQAVENGRPVWYWRLPDADPQRLLRLLYEDCVSKI